MSILVYKISTLLGEISILDRISLYVPTGSLVTLLGPSGSGKSTLLRVIAGLDIPIYGSIWLNNKDITLLPVQLRKIGFVFQNSALFKHMNVQENICFGFKLRKLSDPQTSEKINYLLDSLRIKEILFQYPSQLSGGQKQRVALARSLMVHPEFLLLDEPFGALDGEMRRHLTKWLKKYLRTHQITTIMVTHDHKEALSIADEILILKQGRLVQQGKPKTLYEQPIDRFLEFFLGSLVKGTNKQISSLVVHNKQHKEDYQDLLISDTYSFGFRPHELHLQLQSDFNAFPATVKAITYRRHFVQLDLWITTLTLNVVINLGYSRFTQLNITFLSQIVYVKPRLNVTIPNFVSTNHGARELVQIF